MKIFLSVGATYNDQQKEFVNTFEQFLVEHECKRLTVGRGNYDARQPILVARDLMHSADAVIVLAFTRYVVTEATEKPESDEQQSINSRRYPTIWNQLEAAMAFSLGLPLLIIIEEGLHQEAMLKDRLEFRVIFTNLDPALFSTEEFLGTFKNWKQTVVERHSAPSLNKRRELDKYTVGQLAQDLRPDQLWKILASCFGVLAAVATGAFWIGQTIK